MAATGSVEATRQVAANPGRSHRAPVFTPYLFLAVPVIMFLIWVIGPMFYSFYLSLTNWDGISSPDYIGFANYQRLFKDPLFYTSIGNNVKWLISFITVPVALVSSFLVIATMSRLRMFDRSPVRPPLAIRLVPWMLGVGYWGPVAGLIWSR